MERCWTVCAHFSNARANQGKVCWHANAHNFCKAASFGHLICKDMRSRSKGWLLIGTCCRLKIDLGLDKLDADISTGASTSTLGCCRSTVSERGEETRMVVWCGSWTTSQQPSGAFRKESAGLKCIFSYQFRIDRRSRTLSHNQSLTQAGSREPSGLQREDQVSCDDFSDG